MCLAAGALHYCFQTKGKLFSPLSKVIEINHVSQDLTLIEIALRNSSRVFAHARALLRIGRFR
jgi:hypothetical protein